MQRTPASRTESHLVADILHTYGTGYPLRIWRANCGTARTPGGGLVRFGVPGQADISGILSDGRRLEIECKTKTGRQSARQRAWQRMIEKYGGVYILARSVEDVSACLSRLSISRSTEDTDRG